MEDQTKLIKEMAKTNRQITMAIVLLTIVYFAFITVALLGAAKMLGHI